MQLVQYYTGEITNNAFLSEVGPLAAESQVVLRDISIPDSFAIRKIKPSARQRSPLRKRIGQIVLCRAIVFMSGKDEEKRIW